MHRTDEGWRPANGTERTALTALTTVVTAIGFSALLFGILGVSPIRLNWRKGLLWGLAAFVCVDLAPALGLLPQPPGTAVAGAAPGTPGATTTAPAAAPGMGRVLFNVRPWGQVFVDGADRGVSPPLKSLSLRPGIYNIEVRNGDLEVYRQRVTVQDSKSAPVVSHEFK